VPITEDGARHFFLIYTWSEILKGLDFGVFAIWNLREEDSVLTFCIEVFLVVRVLEIVLARTGISSAWQIVLSHLVGLKKFPLYFG
jgi:hypothetical protein